MRIFLGALAAFSLWAGTSAAQELPEGPVPYAEIYGQETSAVAELQDLSAKPVLSQVDPVWCRFRLGSRTVCEIGCLSVALIDGAWEKGWIDSPVDVLRAFINARAYTRSGDFIWSALPRVIPDVELKDRGSDVRPDTLDASLRADRIVLVRIDRSPARGVQGHYVRVVRVEGDDFVVRDPGRRQNNQGALARLYPSARVIERRDVGRS